MQSIARFAPVAAAACLLLVACDDKKAQTSAPAPAAGSASADGLTEEDRAALATIDAEHDCAWLVSDGTQWHVFSRDIT